MWRSISENHLSWFARIWKDLAILYMKSNLFFWKWFCFCRDFFFADQNFSCPNFGPRKWKNIFLVARNIQRIKWLCGISVQFWCEFVVFIEVLKKSHTLNFLKISHFSLVVALPRWPRQLPNTDMSAKKVSWKWVSSIRFEEALGYCTTMAGGALVKSAAHVDVMS